MSILCVVPSLLVHWDTRKKRMFEKKRCASCARFVAAEKRSRRAFARRQRKAESCP